jgi:hypothetical protein
MKTTQTITARMTPHTCPHWPTGQPADGCSWCIDGEQLGEFVENAVIETWALRTRDSVEVSCSDTDPHEAHEGAVTLTVGGIDRGYVPACCPGRLAEHADRVSAGDRSPDGYEPSAG